MARQQKIARVLAHLIMTAEPIQKTQTVRRATPRQVQAAYQSTNQNATEAQITNIVIP